MEEIKRRRIEAAAPTLEIKAILSDEYTRRIKLIKVYISDIPNKKDISKIMQELGLKIPLPEMRHLKRVHQNKIIICQAKELSQDENLKNYLIKHKISNDIVDLLTTKHRTTDVPMHPIKLRWQYETVQCYWACKFHPDKYLESLYNSTNFTKIEIDFHTKIILLADEISRKMEGDRPFGICTDPRNNLIVAMAASHSQDNPIMHCPMILIDFVARSQGGGAWNNISTKWHKFLRESIEDRVMDGIPVCYHEYVKSNDKWNDLQFGAEASSMIYKEQSRLDDNLSKYGPYLCTGYDVYLTHEPCLMCAMALIHSRIRRLFFLLSNNKTSALGALTSDKVKLHTVRDLNHHYEVFQCLPKTTADK